VLTGGPGAGKTAVLELVRQHFCEHVEVLKEAAGIVFGGGFPRGPGLEHRRSAQRAIFHVQRALEAIASAGAAAVVVCDRGTIDGMAYWPGPGEMWPEVGTSLEHEIGRYEAVIHLRVPPVAAWYNTQNPLRVETAAEAAGIDQRIFEAWRAHPRRFVVEATPEFLDKARRVLDILRAELPDCCRTPARARPDSPDGPPA